MPLVRIPDEIKDAQQWLSKRIARSTLNVHSVTSAKRSSSKKRRRRRKRNKKNRRTHGWTD